MAKPSPAPRRTRKKQDEQGTPITQAYLRSLPETEFDQLRAQIEEQYQHALTLFHHMVETRAMFKMVDELRREDLQKEVDFIYLQKEMQAQRRNDGDIDNDLPF